MAWWPRTWLVAVVLLALAGAARAQVTVGGKTTTAQRVLAETTSQYLDAQGYDVRQRAGMRATVLRHAQRSGQVDLVWETVGTALMVHHGVADAAGLSPQAAHAKATELDAANDLVWLQPTDAAIPFALAMREDRADALGIASLSDVVARVKRDGALDLGVTSAWAGRPDGLAGFQQHHDIRWPGAHVHRMQAGRIYAALADGTVDVASVRAADGRIRAFDLRLLADDEGFFPSYRLAPVVRAQALAEHPGLREQLNRLGATLDTAAIRALTRRVAVGTASIAAAARAHLTEAGLVE